MKKIGIGILVLIMGLMSALTLVACAPNQSSPEAVAKVYVKAIANSDTDTLSKILATDGSTDEVFAVAVSIIGGENAKATTLNFVKYEKVSGDETTEVGKITISNQDANDEETETFNFKKIDGKWYIVLFSNNEG